MKIKNFIKKLKIIKNDPAHEETIQQNSRTKKKKKKPEMKNSTNGSDS